MCIGNGNLTVGTDRLFSHRQVKIFKQEAEEKRRHTESGTSCIPDHTPRHLWR